MNIEFLILGSAAVIIGGLVKGLSGFGYAVVSTSLLASLFQPSKAVAFMILPLIAIQLELVNNLEKREIKTCTNNFKPYIVGLTVGTLAGFFSISLLPTSMVKAGLGLLTFVFALSRIDSFSVHLGRLKKKCFRKSAKVQIPLGIVSGVVFGATNVGVQVVAYLKSMELPNRKFVGLLALIMIPVSGLRIPLILTQGNSLELVAYSILTVPLGMASASLGSNLAEKVSEEHVEEFTVILLILISINLVRATTL